MARCLFNYCTWIKRVVSLHHGCAKSSLQTTRVMESRNAGLQYSGCRIPVKWMETTWAKQKSELIPRRMPSSGVWRRVDVIDWTDVLEDRIASIYRVEKSASEEPAWPATCSRWFFARGFFYLLQRAATPELEHGDDVAAGWRSTPVSGHLRICWIRKSPWLVVVTTWNAHNLQ
jgi:hypothetical protein